MLLRKAALFATACLTIIPTAASQVVINEIMQNPESVGDGDGEWFELFNTGNDPVDIEGWTIRDDGSNTHVIQNGGPLLIDGGGL
ncbi:MAG: lamin tail domain-containing protein, partial [Ignavibacteria bacterium]|nr:lamin tail domain-containing protein [Ignavibacteria bacterium]